jgi:hypothetical protein
MKAYDPFTSVRGAHGPLTSTFPANPPFRITDEASDLGGRLYRVCTFRAAVVNDGRNRSFSTAPISWVSMWDARPANTTIATTCHFVMDRGSA